MIHILKLLSDPLRPLDKDTPIRWAVLHARRLVNVIKGGDEEVKEMESVADKVQKIQTTLGGVVLLLHSTAKCNHFAFPLLGYSSACSWKTPDDVIRRRFSGFSSDVIWLFIWHMFQSRSICSSITLDELFITSRSKKNQDHFSFDF